MAKSQQLVSSLGATVVVADAEHDFFIAEHDAHEDDAPADTTPKPVKKQATEFSSAVKSLLTHTTCYK
ncbi:MAG: hypothetical protein HYX63_00530 [Gammaproteobacteria bacterium]|nr:hypothetical protein [Gammaproteobacteria bacterium]